MKTNETRFYDPKNDVAFKRIFGQEEHKDLLIDFLNAVFEERNQDPIVAVDFLNPNQIPEHRTAKASIVDVACRDSGGGRYIVGMQVPHQPDFIKRVQFYAANEYVDQLNRGDKYKELQPVILLSIVNHVLFPKKTNYISHHETLDVDTKECDLKDVSYCFIELPKFKKKEKDLENIKQQWVYFLKTADSASEIPETIKSHKIQTAYATLERFRWDEDQRRAYFHANLYMQDEEIKLEAAEQKGRAEGLEEGQRKANLETARLMLSEGFTGETILKITKISEQNLDSLK